MRCDFKYDRTNDYKIKISIHAPRMRCDSLQKCEATHYKISIHAPRMRCDDMIAWTWNSSEKFQSTHLVWDATSPFISNISCIGISIHAPRMRCDVFGDEHFMGTTNFNPRTSYEMRRDAFFKCSMHLNDFNPRTSYEMRPFWKDLIEKLYRISIHAPRMRCDVKDIPTFSAHSLFQSTHLVWDATV